MAATAHFFAWAGLKFPAAVNGPQYLAGRGTMDPQFRPRGDVMHVPIGPGLGVKLAEEAQTSMSTVAEVREALPA
jgi:L-alanine-DL-glutamate epimerase-like enolase superfamily enzyme